MQLYAGPTHHFIQDAVHNAIADKLTSAFQHYHRYRPAPSEVHSWRNSLRAMSMVLQEGRLEETSVVLEYQLPLTSRRLDCMVMGQDATPSDQAVIVELKQWEEAEPSDVEDCVVTRIGGGEREVLHPSAQVAQYRAYLEDMHTAFQGPGRVSLAACAYLHNANWRDGASLIDPRYDSCLQRAPLFFGNQASTLVQYLAQRVRQGDPGHVLGKVTGGQYRPSKTLMRHVAKMIEDNPVYTLLDEQLVVFNSILSLVREGFHGSQKAIVLVKGGPGTGKSVIAANLVARLNKLGYKTQHATGSRAFTENLRKAVGSRAAPVFSYFNSFSREKDDSLDVLICDEAHRIRASSANRYTPKANRSQRRQIQELIDVARVSVFFIDDLQVVRPGEVGSCQLIREEAAAGGVPLKQYELEAQFRCQGSEGFVNWVDNTLGIRRTADVIWDAGQAMRFEIVPTVEELERRIRAHHEAGEASRLVAGFCWPWSMKPRADGPLVEDVVIGDWRRPWNARPDSVRLAPGIPMSNLWATDARGIDQVGCVYTAQGFEFDYVGVIFGRDLVYDPKAAEWVGDPGTSYDREVKRAGGGFLDLVRQTYRVLLTRGLKGCYVYFEDAGTEAFFRSRVEGEVGARGAERLSRPAEAPAAAPEGGRIVEAEVLAARASGRRRVAPGRPGKKVGGREAAGGDAPPARAAEPTLSGWNLTKTGYALLPVFRRLGWLPPVDRVDPASASPGAAGPGPTASEVLDVLADLAHALDREDFEGWRFDPAVAARLEASLSRIARGVGADPDPGGRDPEALVRAVMAEARGWETEAR